MKPVDELTDQELHRAVLLAWHDRDAAALSAFNQERQRRTLEKRHGREWYGDNN